MAKLFKIIFVVAVFVFGQWLGFQVGQSSATKIAKQSYEAYESTEAFNKFVSYETTRDIASALKQRNYKQAKCLADLLASSGYDYVSSCIKDKQCASYITHDVKNRTPEVLENTHSNFDYIPEINKMRKCPDA